MLDWRVLYLATTANSHREKFESIGWRAEDLRYIPANESTFIEMVGLIVPYAYHGFLARSAEELLHKIMKKSDK